MSGAVGTFVVGTEGPSISISTDFDMTNNTDIIFVFTKPDTAETQFNRTATLGSGVEPELGTLEGFWAFYKLVAADFDISGVWKIRLQYTSTVPETIFNRTIRIIVEAV